MRGQVLGTAGGAWKNVGKGIKETWEIEKRGGAVLCG